MLILGRLKQAANLVLLVQMLGAIYVHWASNDPLDRCTPALTFTMLLICRYIVQLQVRAREERERKRMEEELREMDAEEEEEDEEKATGGEEEEDLEEEEELVEDSAPAGAKKTN